MAPDSPSATNRSDTTPESSAASPPPAPSPLPASTEKVESRDITLSAISYPLPAVGILILANSDLKTNPHLRRNAVQALALCAVLLPLSFIFTILPVLGCLAPIAWLGITGYYGYRVYQGDRAQIPVLTDFCESQRWI